MELHEIKNNIFCGDVFDTIKKYPSECVDLMMTSPPYFGCRQYDLEENSCELGREESPVDFLENMFEVMMELKRVLKSNGSLYLNMGDVYFGTKGFSRSTGKFSRRACKHYKNHKIVKADGKYLQHKQLLLLPTRLAAMMQEEGWILRNTIIWNRLNPMPSFSEDRRIPIYEYIFHFVKSQKYYFNYDQAKKLNHHRDIITCGVEKYKKHEASFPEKMIEPFIVTTSIEGDLIMDPFMGSGWNNCCSSKKNWKKLYWNRTC